MSGLPCAGRRAALAAWLDDGRAVDVLVDARTPGVVVPAALSREPALVLRLEPSPRLELAVDAVEAWLAFAPLGLAAFGCRLPYEAIFMARAVPTSAAGDGPVLAFEQTSATVGCDARPVPRGKPRLTLLKGGRS